MNDESFVSRYAPALIFIAFACLGLFTRYLGIVLALAWAYICTNVVRHYVFHRGRTGEKLK
jgi:hypothetical protein